MKVSEIDRRLLLYAACLVLAFWEILVGVCETDATSQAFPNLRFERCLLSTKLQSALFRLSDSQANSGQFRQMLLERGAKHKTEKKKSTSSDPLLKTL